METPENTFINRRPKLILFDVYGTLLDMGELQKRINRLVDNKKGFLLWYNILMQSLWLDNSMGQYHKFDVLAELAMDMAAKAFGEQITSAQKEEVLQLMKQLPVHEDVQAGLSRLRDNGYHLATFTNESVSTITERMQRTGLISYFDAILSGESVKKHKPATGSYQWAAGSLGMQLNEVLMVSVHGWDIAGALYAGIPAAFIERKDQFLYPLAPRPECTVKDLLALAGHLQKGLV